MSLALMIRAVLLDIEGTTTDLAFVKEILFPYARKRLADFVRKHREEPEVRAVLREVQELEGRPLSEEEIISCLLRWSDEDRKVAPLKTLQGMIWREGYEKGHFRAHLYPDVFQKLLEWKERGLRLAVFSSGSVEAQKLLFSHTPFGDLTPLFDGFFDTRNAGQKRSPASYRRIAERLGLRPEELLFLSDVEAELDAAREAGLETIQLVRDERTVASPRHRKVSSFAEIDL